MENQRKESKMLKKVLTQKTSKHRLTEVEILDCSAMPKGGLNNSTRIQVSEEICQTMIGFGGAFTEATAITLSKLSKDLRDEVLKLYFDKEKGISYNIGRVHIHSCDFAIENYTYVEENDKELNTFSIKRDQEFIIPLIKDAFETRGEELKLLASPWSPPRWMKSNNNMNQGGQLLPEYFESWAHYYIRFIEEYEKVNIPIWGLTVQNEPEAVQTWDSCIYTAEEERDFVKNYLGPMLHRYEYNDKKLLIWDHNRDNIVERASTVLEDAKASEYVWGTAFHWYVSEAFENVAKVHDLFPDKHLLFTEGCQEGGVHLGAWHTGERYARNMIGDFNSWCEGYLDWNLVLNEIGGPNHVGNYCDAPIIADTVKNQIHINSSYYYIGHFSKYIQEGAKRLYSTISSDQVSSVSFVNPDKSRVVIVMNESDQLQKIMLSINGDNFEDELCEHSIATYIFSD